MSPDRVLLRARDAAAAACLTEDDAGRLWLGAWPAGEAERTKLSAVSGFVPQLVAGQEWTAVGGVLPPGAAGAEVLEEGGAWRAADTGEGLWLAVIASASPGPRTPRARFANAAGELVPRPWPEDVDEIRPLAEGELRLGSLADASGACPVCGARSWDVGVISGSGGLRVACARCGHSDDAVRMRLTPG
jgi:hypothetical protein